MPGTSSFSCKRRNHHFRPYNNYYFKPHNNYNKNEQSSKCSVFDYICIFLGLFILIFCINNICDNIHQYELKKEKFITHHSSYINVNQSQNLADHLFCKFKYIDKCNIKNQANLYGLNTCEFNHILNTKLNKSEDEDGFWVHLNYYYENNKYLIFMKRSNFIVAIKGNLSTNYDFNGSYYVLNGYTNKMYGNCSLIKN